MIRSTYSAGLLVALALLLGVPHAARAAESYDNCTGYITTLPAVISTQGTWCLKQDLNTAMTSGSAITINTNNVTIDCNNFKIDGLAAGSATTARAIYALDRSNETIRRCVVRGFFIGMFLTSTGGADIGGGHVVEDNLFDGNTFKGMEVDGSGSVVQRNRVFNTGGTTSVDSAYGIVAGYSVDIRDNLVSGVTGRIGGNAIVAGISSSSNVEGSVSDNRVRALVKDGTGKAIGIIIGGSGSRATLRGNDLTGDASAGSTGVNCASSSVHVRDNIMAGFLTPLHVCTGDSSNVIAP
jgi:hypothetical protein